jgi:hypothetical protein
MQSRAEMEGRVEGEGKDLLDKRCRGCKGERVEQKGRDRRQRQRQGQECKG